MHLLELSKTIFKYPCSAAVSQSISFVRDKRITIRIDRLRLSPHMSMDLWYECLDGSLIWVCFEPVPAHDGKPWTSFLEKWLNKRVFFGVYVTWDGRRNQGLHHTTALYKPAYATACVSYWPLIQHARIVFPHVTALSTTTVTAWCFYHNTVPTTTTSTYGLIDIIATSSGMD